MTAERISGAWRGCVLTIETGVAVVLTDGGRVRASCDGRMLSRVARDPRRAPQAGDWVDLRAWPDGRVTIADCPTSRRTPGTDPGTDSSTDSSGDAVVLPLRASRRRA